MAAQTYYNPRHLAFDNKGSVHNVPLKSMQLANTTTVSVHSTNYNPLEPDPAIARLESADRRLKARIRVLRLLSRILGTILSIATLVPLLMTLIKYLQTKNTEYTLQDGTKRTAWPAEPMVWYTYLYTGISAISVIFNLGVMIGYLKSGVKGGNQAARWHSKWEYVVLGGNVVVWAISVGIYKYGSEPVNGSFRDLWGWTCSPKADEVQSEITGVDFGKFCTMQTTAFGIGVLHVATNFLSFLILALVMMRRRSKGKAQKASGRKQEVEPLRA